MAKKNDINRLDPAVAADGNAYEGNGGGTLRSCDVVDEQPVKADESK